MKINVVKSEYFLFKKVCLEFILSKLTSSFPSYLLDTIAKEDHANARAMGAFLGLIIITSI